MSLPRLAQNSTFLDTRCTTYFIVDLHVTHTYSALAVSLRLMSLGRHLEYQHHLLAWLLGRTFLHPMHARVH
jgi:hypothetical protein